MIAWILKSVRPSHWRNAQEDKLSIRLSNKSSIYKPIRGIFFGILFPVSLVLASEAPIRIELRPQIVVKSTHVKLNDLIIIRVSDRRILQRLKDFPLSLAPQSGSTMTIDRETLTSLIHSQFGIDPIEIDWFGPRFSNIRLEMCSVSGQEIAQKAQDSLLSVYKHTPLRAKIRRAYTPQDVSVPIGKVDLRPRTPAWVQAETVQRAVNLYRTRSPVFSERQSVWVDVWSGGIFIRTVPVRFDVAVSAPSYVATQNLVTHQPFDLSKLAVREVEWTGSNPLPYPAFQASSSIATAASSVENASSQTPCQTDVSTTMRMSHSLAVGETLTQAHVEAAPLVTHGDFAILHVNQGAVALESRVEVLQDGILGQNVRVKMANASSVFLARVVGPGLVEITR